MYAVKGTAGPVHKAAHAVVITNGVFTRDAMAWGERHGVHWVDRDRLQRWARDGAALSELLGLSATRAGRFRRAASRRVPVVTGGVPWRAVGVSSRRQAPRACSISGCPQDGVESTLGASGWPCRWVK